VFTWLSEAPQITVYAKQREFKETKHKTKSFACRVVRIHMIRADAMYFSMRSYISFPGQEVDQDLPTSCAGTILKSGVL
jgi:hypothetical protein